jgi:outer membrane protein TolC
MRSLPSRALVAWLLVMFCAPAGAEEPPETVVEETVEAEDTTPRVALDELVKRAERHAASLSVRDAAIRNAEWKQTRADWAWTPKIEAQTLLAPVPANTDPNRVGANLDEIGNLNIGPFIRQTIRIVVPIYTFGRIDGAQELAGVNLENAKLERKKAQLDLQLQVKRAYYGLQLASAFDAMLADGQVLIKEQLVKMEEDREFGEADFEIKDLRKLQIFDADLDARALDNRKLITLALAGLEYLTGDTFKLAQIKPLDEKTPLPELASLEVYRERALANRPEIAQLDRAVRARRIQKELEFSEFFPLVFIAGDMAYGWSTESIAKQPICRVPTAGAECVYTDDLFARPYSNPYQQFTVGIALGLRWNIDIMDQYGQYKEAEASLEQTQAQQRQALGAIDLELKKLYVDASNALERVSIQRRRLDAARRWRDQFGLSAQSGGGKMSDAIDPLKAYYEARVLYLQSVYDYLSARAELAVGLGLSALD